MAVSGNVESVIVFDGETLDRECRLSTVEECTSPLESVDAGAVIAVFVEPVPAGACVVSDCPPADFPEVEVADETFEGVSTAEVAVAAAASEEEPGPPDGMVTVLPSELTLLVGGTPSAVIVALSVPKEVGAGAGAGGAGVGAVPFGGTETMLNGRPCATETT